MDDIEWLRERLVEDNWAASEQGQAVWARILERTGLAPPPPPEE